MRATRHTFALLVVAAMTAGLLPALAGPAGASAQAAPRAQAGGGDAVPTRPEQLRFTDLNYETPKAEKYRHRLKNGAIAYIAEDHALPLVSVSILLRAGAFLDPPGKPGVGTMTGTLLRLGGTERLTAEEFDEKADFLAANIGSYSGDTEAGASLSCLSSALTDSLDLFFEMLRSPRFQQGRLDVERGKWLEGMKQRNDDAGDILSREWGWLLYGENHFSSRELTKSEAEAITRDDMIEFHRKWWRPENMILAVSGDVKTEQIIAELDRRFAGWKTQGPAVPWPPPAPTHVPKPGLYHVDKDIPQGKVSIGHLSTRWDRWDNPDNFALMVMNMILGGGGFTSRITKQVRSNEGLAYSAGSRFGIGAFWPEEFRIFYQTKNATVAFAAKLSLAEVRSLQEQPVTDEELSVAKSSFIDTFPQSFESAGQIARTFARDDQMGRPHSYWQSFRDNIRKVTAADVQRVARAYLHPDAIVFLVVGKWSEIEPGDPDGRASMKELFGGKVTHLPLRDPLTLQPPS